MKKLISLLIVTCLALGFAEKAAAIDFGSFSTHLTEAFLNPFAKDMGPVLGGGTYSGGNCGFPGIDVSAKLVLVSKPSADDLILPQNTVYGLAFAQIDVGLPMGIIPMFRIFSLQPEGSSASISVLGGGIKYKLLDDNLAIPGVSVSATYHFFSGYTDFDLNTMSANLIISKSLSPIPLSVFIGAGYDVTNITSKIAPFAGVKGSGASLRYNAGARFTLLPLIYINADAGYVESRLTYTLGGGAAF